MTVSAAVVSGAADDEMRKEPTVPGSCMKRPLMPGDGAEVQSTCCSTSHFSFFF